MRYFSWQEFDLLTPELTDASKVKVIQFSENFPTHLLFYLNIANVL